MEYKIIKNEWPPLQTITGSAILGQCLTTYITYSLTMSYNPIPSTSVSTLRITPLFAKSLKSFSSACSCIKLERLDGHPTDVRYPHTALATSAGGKFDDCVIPIGDWLAESAAIWQKITTFQSQLLKNIFHYIVDTKHSIVCFDIEPGWRFIFNHKTLPIYFQYMITNKIIVTLVFQLLWNSFCLPRNKQL